MKHLLLFALLYVTCGCVTAAPVTVTPIAYHGWANAVRLSNGVVEVVIVPRIGRIMAVAWAGQPQTSPIYQNPGEQGKPAPPEAPFPKVWANFGGDKVWPSPQSDWPQHQPTGWPPDPAFDTGPYVVSRVHNGVRLTGPVSPYYGIRVMRDITLRPRGAWVDIHDTFVRVRPGVGTGANLPVGIWSVCQVRGDAAVFLPLETHHAFPGSGYTRLQSTTPLAHPLWQAAQGMLTVQWAKGVSGKVGVDDRAGWLACLYGGNQLFAVQFQRALHGQYPDNGCDAEVYINGDPATPYLEMELLGRLAHLRPGQSLARSLTWHLLRLPRRPRNAAEARRLVRAALEGLPGR